MSTKPANQSVRLTKTNIDRCPNPESGQIILRDPDLRGFGCRITANGTRSFIVEKRINGRVRRMTIGRYGELTPVQARQKAQQVLGQIAMGVDPAAERRRRQLREITLETVFEDFRRARKNLKPKTLYDYERTIRIALPDWRKRPINAISPSMVHAKHRQIGESRGEAYANLTMRCLRAIFNFAAYEYDDGTGIPVVRSNPVDSLSRNHAWYRIQRRQTVIWTYQLAPWYRAVEALRMSDNPQSLGDTVADYLLTLLFTGLRKSEALGLRWADVDLEDRSIHIPTTKNDEAHTLPTGEYLTLLLRRRQLFLNSSYVFPGNTGRRPLVEMKKQTRKVIDESQVTFTLHDLRRTYITQADSLGISPYTIKRLVNHKTRNDVTAGYIVSDLVRMRKPQQQIEDFFIENCGIRNKERLIEFLNSEFEKKLSN